MMKCLSQFKDTVIDDDKRIIQLWVIVYPFLSHNFSTNAMAGSWKWLKTSHLNACPDIDYKQSIGYLITKNRQTMISDQI